MARRHDDDAHGVTPRELEVLDRADAGMSREQIVREVGVKRSYVDTLLRLYAISDTAERRWVKAAAIASARYVAAVAATGGSFR